MNEYTKKQWNKFGTMHTSLVEFAYEFMTKFCDKNEIFMSVIIDNETQTIDITTELYWGGDTDYNSYSMPVLYLYTEGWDDLYQVLLDERKRKEIADKLERETKRKEKKHADDYANFLKLKKRFGE